MRQKIFAFQKMPATIQQGLIECQILEKQLGDQGLNRSETNLEKSLLRFFFFSLNFRFDYSVHYVDWQMLMLP